MYALPRARRQPRAARRASPARASPHPLGAAAPAPPTHAASCPASAQWVYRQLGGPLASSILLQLPEAAEQNGGGAAGAAGVVGAAGVLAVALPPKLVPRLERNHALLYRAHALPLPAHGSPLPAAPTRFEAKHLPQKRVCYEPV